MSEVDFDLQRFHTALQRILKFLNDALNRPPSQISLLAELRAQLLVARKVATEQGLSEQNALIQAGSPARSFDQLERDITAQEQAPALPSAPSPQRKVYTLEDAQTVLADSQIMAEQEFFQRTGSQPDRTAVATIGAYLIENLLGEQRGAPANFVEGLAEQVVTLQGEAIVRNPESVTQTRRLRDFYDALIASDNPNASIDQETFNALVFPATQASQVPLRFRASVPVSGTAVREAELKALDVINNLTSNMLGNLQKIVDVSGGPTGISNFREGAARIVSEQSEEEVLAGTNTLPSVDSPSDIRAQQRSATALGTLRDTTNISKAFTAAVGSPELETDKDRKRDKAQAIRLAVDRVEERRREILRGNSGISEEDLQAQLAPFMGQEVETFDQTLSEVAQEFSLQKFDNLGDIEKELGRILGDAGLDVDEIDSALLTQIAQAVMQEDLENRPRAAQNIIGAFPFLQQESIAIETAADAPKTVAAAEKIFKDELEKRGVFDPPAEVLNRGALTTFQAGGEVTEESISQGIAGTQREQAFGATQALTTSDRNLNAFVFGKLRDEGVFSRTSGPAFIQNITENVLPGVAAEVAEILEDSPFSDPDRAFDTAFENLATPREPTFGVGGLTERDFERQLGITGIPTSLLLAQGGTRGFPERDLGDAGALFAEAAGESPAFLRFLQSREASLQGAFRSEGRGQVREERARLQGVGEDLSEAQSAARSAFRGASLSREGDIRRGLTDEAPARGGAELAALQRREEGLTRQIETTSFFQRLARPRGTFADFFKGRLGSLRQTFGQTPAGIREGQRLESEAERRRRRALRDGRTVFRPTFGR